MKAYDFMCEDKSRTDAPELEYFTRFIDRLCDPEDPKEYRESMADYPPMTDAEIAQARVEALEHKRLLNIELKQARVEALENQRILNIELKQARAEALEHKRILNIELAKARAEALEHKRLLNIELERVYRVAKILGAK